MANGIAWNFYAALCKLPHLTIEEIRSESCMEVLDECSEVSVAEYRCYSLVHCEEKTLHCSFLPDVVGY